jgi:tetratricopeptide (TPR) repeat protein
MPDDLATHVSALRDRAMERLNAGDGGEVQRAADALLAVEDEVLARSDPGITRALLDVGAAVFSAGDLQRAQALMHKGITALSNNPAASRADQIVPLNNLIALYDKVGDHQRASGVAGYLGGLVEQLNEPVTGNAVTVLLQMAQMYEERGQLNAALVFYRPVHGFMMSSPDLERDTVLGWVRKYLQVLLKAEQYDAVQSLGEQVLATALESERIELLAIVATAAARAGDVAAHEDALDRAAALAERLDAAGSLTGRARIAAGAVYHNLAVHYLDQHKREQYPRGQQLLEREIAILAETGRGGSAEHAGALGQLAVLTDACGQAAEAERLYVESVSMYQAAPDTSPAEFADFLTDLGMLRLRHGRAADAVAPFERALVLRDSSGAGVERRAEAASNLATAYFDAGDLSAATIQFTRAIDLRFAALSAA